MHPTGMLGNELGKLGLSQDPREIVGRTLVFGDKENHVICGTIISIGYGPNEGVSLQVSSPKFRGCRITKIFPSADGIAMLLTELEEVHAAGQFEIL